MIKADIQFVRSLAEKRVRDQERLFVAEGSKLTEEILASKFVVRRIYTTRHDLKGKNIEVVDQREMERISQLKTANDTLAVVEQPNHKLSLANLRGKLTIALDGVQNPGNLGTIIRLADWFGITDIVCSEQSADCFNPKVVQATMGAIIRVRVHYTDLAGWLECQHNRGVNIYGTFLDGQNIYKADKSRCGVIVMGNEGNGVSAEVANLVNERLYIPNYPPQRETSESLNVAMATGVICAEFRRRMANV